MRDLTTWAGRVNLGGMNVHSATVVGALLMLGADPGDFARGELGYLVQNELTARRAIEWLRVEGRSRNGDVVYPLLQHLRARKASMSMPAVRAPYVDEDGPEIVSAARAMLPRRTR